MAPFGAKMCRMHHTIAKYRHFSFWRQMAPFGAKSGATWRHAAPRGASGDRHSQNIGDSWRYRHMAMVHSLKKNMRKIVIAKWRHLAPLSDQEIKSPNGTVWRQTSPFGAKFRQMAVKVSSPFGAKCRHMAPIVAIWRQSFVKVSSLFGAERRHMAPNVAIWRQTSPYCGQS